MRDSSRTGFTLIELVITLAVMSAMLLLGFMSFAEWTKDQAAKSSARAVADAFLLARGEAIRSGSQHIVAFDIESGLSGITSDIVIANDGAPNAANCRIDPGEIVHSVSLEDSATFGMSLAGGTAAPDDTGSSGDQANGASFTDAESPAGDASWVVFLPDGIPRLFTQNAAAPPPCDSVSPSVDGGGAIYVTNGRRDYAVVLSVLGAVRVHHWVNGAWSD